jgi:hypothetical protein
MGYHIRAKSIGSCSCKMSCRCVLGPAEPDQGWCSAALAFQVLEGESEGVDLDDVRAVLVADLPGDFFGGFDLVRLYVDESASDEQRREFEAVLQGERGGAWAGVREMIREWLPTQTAAISISDGDAPTVTIDGVGQTKLQPVMTESGKRAAIVNAPIGEALGEDRLELALATGTAWSDPDMRPWESLGYGTESVAEWSS